MLTTNKILAHKRSGKNLVLLTQVETSFFLVFAHVVSARKTSSLKVLAERELSHEEMLAVYMQMTERRSFPKALSLSGAPLSEPHASRGAVASAAATYDASAILLLETPKAQAAPTSADPVARPIISPYFPTKDIFLSIQKTRGPNLA